MGDIQNEAEIILEAHAAYIADLAVCNDDPLLIWEIYVDLFETNKSPVREPSIARCVRKARTEASYNKSDRAKHGIGRGNGTARSYKRTANRANRRLDAAICRDALLSH